MFSKLTTRRRRRRWPLPPARPWPPAAKAHVDDFDFSFEGPFGTYDQNQLQRGLKVYTEVCSACHGLKYVPIRTLARRRRPAAARGSGARLCRQFRGLDDPETATISAPAKPTDHFPELDAGECARPVSLMAKARAGFHGPYGTGHQPVLQRHRRAGIHRLAADRLHRGEDQGQTGFGAASDAATRTPPSPAAGSPWRRRSTATMSSSTTATSRRSSSEAKDVAAFLMWTAEPKMMARKQAGFTGVHLPDVLSVLLYLTNKRHLGADQGQEARLRVVRPLNATRNSPVRCPARGLFCAPIGPWDAGSRLPVGRRPGILGEHLGAAQRVAITDLGLQRDALRRLIGIRLRRGLQ